MPIIKDIGQLCGNAVYVHKLAIAAGIDNLDLEFENGRLKSLAGRRPMCSTHRRVHKLRQDIKTATMLEADANQRTLNRDFKLEFTQPKILTSREGQWIEYGDVPRNSKPAIDLFRSNTLSPILLILDDDDYPVKISAPISLKMLVSDIQIAEAFGRDRDSITQGLASVGLSLEEAYTKGVCNPIPVDTVNFVFNRL